jgi:DNA polymerase/3'-5' exonuclease PolX
MNLHHAKPIAEAVKLKLAPYCDQVEIGGSIRRQRQEVGDIEIVCIPKMYSPDLFGEQKKRIPGFYYTILEWPSVRGDPVEGKYTQRVLPEGIKLDIFTATPINWGLIFAIRTGSADWVKNVLAARWVQCGYHSYQGILRKNVAPIETPNERGLFDLLEMPWTDPRDREWSQA